MGAGLAVAGGLRPPRGFGANRDEPDTPLPETFRLKCEYATNPLGIDAQRPRFSWKVQSSGRGWMQSAYQVLVATNEDKLGAGTGDKWDSGKVASDQSVNIAYSGNALNSGERCYWRVRTWDQKGRVSDSPLASFEMGLLDKRDWKAKWIAADKGISAPLFRKEFNLEEPITRARVYISGLGYYELYLNGKKVSDHVHDPGVTYYDNSGHPDLQSKILYVTHDVTDFLKPGRNAIGVILGNGWYSPKPGSNFAWLPGGRMSPFGDRPCLLMQMQVGLSNGRSLKLETDDTWHWSSGPITYNSFINGETYDARLEKPGWNNPGYDESAWNSAVLVDHPPNGALKAQMLPPIRVVESIKPVRILRPKDPELFSNVYVFDMGQNFTGWTKLRVAGARGTKITLEHGANIYDDNTLDARSNLGEGTVAKQTDTYILKGKGTEEWEPKFTLHGFRYVQVRGLPGEPTLDSVEGRFAHSAVEKTGSFSCSNQLINKTHHNNLWAFRSSCQSIPQDAADRAERVAWMGDPGFVTEDFIYNLDMASFWTKWLSDIQGSQKPNGDVPVISPLPCGRDCEELYSYPIPDWKSNYAIMAWKIYQYYRDERILEEHYESLRKLIDFLGTACDGYIMSEGLGDQMEPQSDGVSLFRAQHTPVALTSTALYYYQVWIMSRAAKILGKNEDADRYSELADKVKRAFNIKFLDRTTNQYATGSQTSNAVPLFLNMVPNANVGGVLQNLIHNIVEVHHGHLSTGVIGTDALEHALPAYGAADVMLQIVTQTTFPGWGFQVKKGATTTCESWECAPWISQNMKMMGMIETFFYKDLAGIRLIRPGFKKIAIKPQVVGGLRYVNASLNTVMGSILVAWKRDDRSFEMKVVVPSNTQAEVSIPTLQLRRFEIKESGNTVWRVGNYLPGVAGITGGRENSGYVAFNVGSGTYLFRLTEMKGASVP